MTPPREPGTAFGPSSGGAALRASDRERERTLAELRDHAAVGRLLPEEHEERSERALRARTRADLAALTADLPEPGLADSSFAGSPGPRSHGLRAEIAAYVAVNLLLVVVWAATGAGYFWPIWPIAGWGVGLVLQGLGGPSRGACGQRRQRAQGVAESAVRRA